MVRARTANRSNKLAPRLLGVMLTNWGGSDKFVDAYRAEKAEGAKPDSPVMENFLRLFARTRELATAKP